MPRNRIAAMIAAAALAGAGAGAGAVALAGGGSHSAGGTTTVVAAGGANVANAALTVGQIAKADTKSVVEIDATTSGSGSFPFGGGGSGSAEGTGFVYDAKGDIVTNQHVVSGASSLSVKFSDGSTYKATLVGADPSTDIAV
ncbi:MAG TPA: trypsin-like peptidase domain-containing protein, partial [Gaiellaceae bacterium]